MRGLNRRAILALGVALSVGALGACDDDEEGPTGNENPTMASVAGTYEATTLIATEEGEQPFDVLAANAANEVTVTLTPTGTTTGRMFFVGLEDDGSDLETDLTGTYTLSGNTIRFAHAGDTFLREEDLTVSGNRITGTLVQQHDVNDPTDITTINLVLTKQ